MLRVNTLSGFGGIRPSGGSFDADAETFFTAAGITDNTQKGAVSDLVTTLKADSIWSKFHAIYPFVGGTSSTHLVNLKNPGTFDITWAGTVTHDANGITPNGSTGYGDTGFIDDTHGTLDSIAFGVYSRTTGNLNAFEMGAQGGAGGSLLVQCQAFNFFSYSCQDFTTNSTANTTATGLFVVSRTASAGYRVQMRGTNSNITQASTAKSIRSLYIGALNNDGSPGSFSSRNLAFGFISSGLTEGEAGDLDTAVVTFQTALSRNV